MSVYKLKHTGAELDAACDTVGDLLNFVYPVGSIYMSVNAANPGSFLGGSWVSLEGRFLLGAGGGYEAGGTGGSATHTNTWDEMAPHSHESTIDTLASSNLSNPWGDLLRGNDLAGNKESKKDVYTHIASSGGGRAYNIMPPYLVVYMWKRTA